MNNMQDHNGSSGGESTLRKLQLHLLLSFVYIATHQLQRGYASKSEGHCSKA